jgi:molybdenum cofactor synthesis domain-containing protein
MTPSLDRSGHPNPVPRVVGTIRRKHPVEIRDLQFLRANTDRQVKITVPGPFTMSQQAQNDFYADEEACDLIATTGGTGLSPDDLTPEATRDVIDREAPGIAEAMRLASREHVPKHWMLSRGVAGSRGRTLIVNFPGNPNAIEQAGAAIAPSLGHALGLLRRR